MHKTTLTNYFANFSIRKVIFIVLFIYFQNDVTLANEKLVDQKKVLSVEFKNDLQFIQNKLLENGYADLGIVILKNTIPQSLINEAVLWSDLLNLGEAKDNEILLLIIPQNHQSYIYLGNNFTITYLNDQLITMSAKDNQNWLKSEQIEKAIRSSLVKIIDFVGAENELRQKALANDKDLIEENKKNNYLFYFGIIGIILLLAFLVSFLVRYTHSKKTMKKNNLSQSN